MVLNMPLSLRTFFCFVFGKMLSSLPMLLVMLFAHVGKSSSSRLQMFFKTCVLENFAILTGNDLCWSLFLFKNSLQYRCFFVNIARFLRTAFLQKTSALYFSKILFDDRYLIFQSYILLLVNQARQQKELPDRWIKIFC